ncbi:hypothetical protein [Terracoccus luteus]|uniref:Uncharacterized protein n=1 Tax=Terracoccus luteus TaxID=53356 RepID=A0A839PX62_9MICO|nr:hypothetical protein [Terracoccus luteus]MBB2988117.1 hypothetical protein [Terracoccus luteus]MCP2174143.1 hypothetical protein [Terracoccus luteus]
MLNPGGYPDSITHISPSGPCTLSITWLYPHDPVTVVEAHARRRATAYGTGAHITAYVTGSPLTLDGLTYHAHAWARLNDDLTFDEVRTHLNLQLEEPTAPAAAEEHHNRWRQHVSTVLTELLTPENYLALHRADTRHRLNDAELDVIKWTRSLEKARATQRRAEILDAVLHLKHPAQRAVGLRLAPTWQGTPDELRTVISDIAGPSQ